jgi:hypothetical protein
MVLTTFTAVESQWVKDKIVTFWETIVEKLYADVVIDWPL